MPGSKNLKSWLKSDIFCKVLIFRLKNYSLKRQDVKTLAMLVREDEFCYMCKHVTFRAK